MTDTITLAGMAFYAYHGLHDEEARLGQRFDIDVAVGLDLAPAGRSDDYADTVGYDRLHRTVEAVVLGPRLNLIEALADRIARAVLAEVSSTSRLAARAAATLMTAARAQNARATIA